MNGRDWCVIKMQKTPMQQANLPCQHCRVFKLRDIIESFDVVRDDTKYKIIILNAQKKWPNKQ